MENDAISRSTAIADLRNWLYGSPDDEYQSGFGSVLLGAITRIANENINPALDVAPVVHARWIYSGEMDEDGNVEANCSRCGAGERHRADLKDAVPFCWKCGARMDGEE